MKKIETNVYYYIDDVTGKKVFDIEEMRREFEDKLSELESVSSKTLFDTDYVIYDKFNDHVLQDSYGRVLIFGDEREAIEDLYGNECVVRCTDLPKHWQEKILNQIES